MFYKPKIYGVRSQGGEINGNFKIFWIDVQRERWWGGDVWKLCLLKRVDIKPKGLLIKACYPFKQCCRKEKEF